jgi:hypothetical protein
VLSWFKVSFISGRKARKGSKAPISTAEETEIAKAKNDTPVDRQRLSQARDFT